MLQLQYISSLQEVIKENERIAISRYIEERGIEFYQLAKQNELEGIVAKSKDSKYYVAKRTKDWIKIKYLLDDDYLVCGYIFKDNGMSSIVLGQYLNKELVYKGHVSIRTSTISFQLIRAASKLSSKLFKHLPSGNYNLVWIELSLICIVKYMMKTANVALAIFIYCT